MTRDEIFDAIENKTPLKVSVKSNGIVAFYKVIPIKITGDDTIIGLINNTDEKIAFDISDISNVVLKEEIKMSSKILDNMDTSKLSQISDKTDIEITEDAGGNFSVDLSNGLEEEVTDETIAEQESSKNDLLTWAAQLKLRVSDITNLNKDVLTGKIIVKNLPKLILIYPNGAIKISGHLIKTFEEFKNLITFFSQT